MPWIAIRPRCRSTCHRPTCRRASRQATVTPFDPPSLEAALRTVAEERGIKAGVLIHAARVAVTGQAVSPGIFEVLELVGRERVLERLAGKTRVS